MDYGESQSDKFLAMILSLPMELVPRVLSSEMDQDVGLDLGLVRTKLHFSKNPFGRVTLDYLFWPHICVVLAFGEELVRAIPLRC